MPVRPNFNPDYLYFVTTTAAKHIHIFKRESLTRIILDSLHFLRTSKRMELFVFVIMPNHIHLIGKFSKEHSLSDVMRDFKRHTARQIIRQLMAEELTEKLGILQSLNQDNRQEYKQKMEYIHYNPCQPQWNLASVPEEYPWSSARYYVLDKPSVIPVDDVRNLFA